jgi:hypothetical protein
MASVFSTLKAVFEKPLLSVFQSKPDSPDPRIRATFENFKECP